MFRINRFFILFVLLVCTIACKDEVLPKPNAMLRLDYRTADYKTEKTKLYSFSKNTEASIKSNGKGSVTLDYPSMKGTVYLTYKPVNNNLKQLLIDAQKLTYEHTVKADNIVEQPFLNDNDKVYGMFYEVTGNAASQSQFYVTDSVQHFLTGSLYFYAKPNYDSIYPAAIYLQRDIRKIMETLTWSE